MAQHKRSTIDGFRVVALLLVVAVHTGPLTSFSETADAVLTQIISRVAVPFFFMATGYFVLGNPRGRRERIVRFVKRTSLYYLAAVILYLPLNWYMGDFERWGNFGLFIRDLFFNGTVYHLWFLPASILGLSFTALLIRKMQPIPAVFLACALYLLALGGDSYYGLASQIPLLKRFYAFLFTFFDYTRNGLLMAPLFFIIGMLTAHLAKHRINTRLSGASAIIFLLLMAAETFFLRPSGWMLHNSMYLFLPAVSACLFFTLIANNTTQNHTLRKISAWGYILHLWVLVGVRGIGSHFGWQHILVRQSLVHFLAVVCGTLFVSWGVVTTTKMFSATKDDVPHDIRAWVEIDLKCIARNMASIKKVLPDSCDVMAVVKANAYGHGDTAVSGYLAANGVRAFAVATLQEGMRLRQTLAKEDILILGYSPPSSAPVIEQHNLIQTVCDAAHAAKLNQYAKRKIRVHIKLDTGMHRLGIDWRSTETITGIYRLQKLHVEGLFSHLSASDGQSSRDIQHTQLQSARFFKTVSEIQRQGLSPGKLHIQGSYGAIHYPHLPCDCVRLGILLYGVCSSQETPVPSDVRLVPALSLKSRVTSLHTVLAGECAGYGYDYKADHTITAATVSIGYADGVPRNYGSTYAQVLLHGTQVPIIGRICMDQLLLDVSAVSRVSVGDIVTLIGRDGNCVIRCEQIAKSCGTLTNEILSRLGDRLPRVYLS